MSELSDEEAKEIIRLVLVAYAESKDSELAWDLAKRLAASHGWPAPLDWDEIVANNIDQLDANAFYV